MNKEIKVAIIGGIFVIIAAIIGVFNYNLNNSNEILEQKNTELSEQNKDWEIAYNELNEQLEELNNQNISLSNEINTLKDSMEQYSSLAGKNESLKSEISELKKEMQTLKDNESLENLENNENHELEAEGNDISDSNGKKVSIFDLDTFKGEGFWFDLSSSEDGFIDTYGNIYLNARMAHHSVSNRSDYFVPTYLLDKKYSICEGQIAWSKEYKNNDGSAWIEFYSGDDCIYTTEVITADSRLLTFSFSVKDIEKLTIVRNGSSSTNAVEIIYPYLNLIE